MTNISTLNDVQKIIVLDYGSQYNQLIARRIREFGVFSELKSHKITADEVRAINPIGIILSGGPNSVYAEDAFGIDEEIFELGIPILGICYGMQLLTHKLGGKVVPAGEAGNREYGQSTLRLRAQSELFAGTPEEQVVLMSHGDAVTEIPEGFHLVADSVDCPFAAMEDTKKNFYGIQFHPEVRHTVYGNDILKNFAFSICGAKGDWSMANFVDMQIAQIRETVGDRKVLLGLSGGVDSSVVGILLQKAIGDQLTCIFVDHGLLRKGEGDQVMEMLGGKFGLNIIRVDASKRFLDLLAGVDDPEKKRKIIGNEFVHVFDDEASKLKGVDFLAQGTLYTDIIESGTETAQTIKSHHNVGGLPEDMQFELIEPLNTLFKMKCALLVLNWECLTRSFGANHSQDQDLPSVLWVKSLKRNLKPFVSLMLFFARKSLRLVLTVMYGNTSLLTQAYVLSVLWVTDELTTILLLSVLSLQLTV